MVPKIPDFGLGYDRTFGIDKDILYAIPGHGDTDGVYLSTWRYFGNSKYLIFRYGNITDHIAQFNQNTKTHIYEAELPYTVTIIDGTSTMEYSFKYFACPVGIDNYYYLAPFQNEQRAIAFATKPDNKYFVSVTNKNTETQFVKIQDFKIKRSSRAIIYQPQADVDIKISSELERLSIRQFGERCNDLKDLMRRYNPFGVAETTVSKDVVPGYVLFTIPVQFLAPVATHGSDTPTARRYLREGAISLLGSGFRLGRGSMRFKLIFSTPENCGISIGIYHDPDSQHAAHVITTPSMYDYNTFIESGFAGVVQDLSLNSVVDVECPYYKTTEYQSVGHFSERDNAAEFLDSTHNGAIKIVAHSKPQKEFKLTVNVMYAFADDCRYSVFNGFGPVVSRSDVPRKKKVTKVFTRSDAVDLDLQPLDTRTESMSSVQSQFEDLTTPAKNTRGKDKKKADGQSGADPQGFLDFLLPSKVEKVCENVSTAATDFSDLSQSLNGMIEQMRAMVTNAGGSQSIVDKIIKLVVNASHLLYSTSIGTMVTVFVQFLLECGIVKVAYMHQFVSVLTNLYTALKGMFFSNELPQGNAVNREVADGQALTVPTFSEDEITSGVSTVLVLLGGCLGINVTKDPKGLFTNTIVRDMKEYAQTSNSLVTFFRTNFAFFSKVIAYLKYQTIGGEGSALAGLVDDGVNVQEWYEKCCQMLNPSFKSTLKQNRAHCMEVFLLKAYGEKILGNCFNHASTVKAHMVIKSTLDKISVLQEELTLECLSPYARFEPYTMQISGGCNIGKSYLIDSLVVDLCKKANIKTTKPKFVVTSGNKYWNGCDIQPICVMDDFLQIQESTAVAEAVSNLFQLKSTQPFNPPIAEIENKKIYYNPIAVIMTSNKSFYDGCTTSCLDITALHRRRNYLVEAVLRDEFKLENGNLDMNKLCTPANKGKFNHLKFRKCFNVEVAQSSEAKWSSDMTYQEFMQDMLLEFTTYMKEKREDYVARIEMFKQLLPDANPSISLNEYRDTMISTIRSGKLNLTPSEGQDMFEAYNNLHQKSNFNFAIPHSGSDGGCFSGNLSNQSSIWDELELKRKEEESKKKDEEGNNTDYTSSSEILTPEKKEMDGAGDFHPYRSQSPTPPVDLSGPLLEDLDGDFYRCVQCKRDVYEDHECPKSNKREYKYKSQFLQLNDEDLSDHEEIQYNDKNIPYVYNKTTKSKNFFVDDEKKLKYRRFFKHIPGYLSHVEVESFSVCIEFMCKVVDTNSIIYNMMYQLRKDMKEYSNFDTTARFVFLSGLMKIFKAMPADKQLIETGHDSKLGDMPDTHMNCIHNRLLLLHNEYTTFNVRTNEWKVYDDDLNEFKIPSRICTMNKKLTGCCLQDWRTLQLICWKRLQACVMNLQLDHFDNIEPEIIAFVHHIAKFCGFIWPELANYAAMHLTKYSKDCISIQPINKVMDCKRFLKATEDQVKKYFAIIKDSVFDFFRKYGSMIIKLCLSASMIYFAYKASNKYLMGSSVVGAAESIYDGGAKQASKGLSTLRKVMSKQANRLVKQRGLFKAKGQAGGQQVEDLIKLISRNSVTFELFDEDRRLAYCNGTGIADRLVVTAGHFIETLSKYYKKNNNCKIHVNINNSEAVVIRFDQLKLFYDDMTSSLAFIRLPVRFPCFRDIRKHIATLHDMDTLAPHQCQLIDNVNGTLRIYDVNAKECEGVEIAGTETSNSFYVESVYTYNKGRMGMCGSCLISTEPHPRIIGIHVAGNGTTVGYAEPISYEGFSELESMSEFVNVAIHPEAGDGNQNVNVEGSFIVEGIVSDPVRMPTQSKYRQTMMHNEITKTKNRPARLNPYQIYRNMDNTQHKLTPLEAGLSKHGNPPIPFDPKMLEKAKDHLQEKLISVCRKELDGKGINPELTDKQIFEGINGIDEMKGIEIHTSEGLPLMKERSVSDHNKAWCFIFDKESSVRELKGLHPKFQAEIDKNMAMRRNNIIPPTTFALSLKDALVSEEKYYKEGGTRVFSVSPLEFSWAIKKYFGWFQLSYIKNRIKSETTVGINPDSIEWAQLLRYFEEIKCDEDGISQYVTGDYKAFGDTLQPECIRAAFEIMIEWYKINFNIDEEGVKIRRILCEELLNSYTQVGNTLVKKFCGLHSGFALTVEINSMVNSLYFRCAWLAQNLQLQYFTSNVRLNCYGDDCLCKVSKDYVDKFNFNTIRDFLGQHNIKFTSASKDENENRSTIPLQDVTYLKRSFKEHPTRKVAVLAPLPVESVVNPINWYKINLSKTEENCLYENCRACLNNAYSLGPDYYSNLRRRINLWWRDHNGTEFSSPTWDELDEKNFGC